MLEVIQCSKSLTGPITGVTAQTACMKECIPPMQKSTKTENFAIFFHTYC